MPDEMAVQMCTYIEQKNLVVPAVNKYTRLSIEWFRVKFV
jgi:hypothetical protein